MSRTVYASMQIAIHTAALAEIDSETGNASLKIYDAGDTLLVSIDLTDPAGSVNGTTGQLTLTPDTPAPNAVATGTASYAELCDAAADPKVRVPCAAGTSPVADTCVLTSLSIVTGYPVEIVSFLIGG